LIYFLLRTGHLVEAVQHIQTPAILASFQTLEPSFPSYLKAYATSPNRTLPRHLLDRLHVEFNQRIRYYKADEDDPFKFALYKLLGRCDIQKRAMPAKVVATSEDYLWVQLVLAREDETVGDRWGLGDVAKGVVKAGRMAWDRSGQRPEGYFLVLILVGEYERVRFLLIGLTIGCTLFTKPFTCRRDSFRRCVGMVWITTNFNILCSLRR
jgi:nuclear pore complex protein Nup93